MKIKFTLLILLIGVQFAQAQLHYSYITDKKFQGTDELIGYTLKPNTLILPDKENPDDSQEFSLNPGDISFLITRNYLVVEAEEYKNYKGAYSINSINQTGYGFKLDLMNARNPSIQGHLKIILNKVNEIDAYIFKASPKEKEVIFYQAEVPDVIRKEEKAYFTDAGEVLINDTTLWGTTIYPFFELDQGQKRLSPKDSLSITFQVDTVVVNKKKNKKKPVYSIIIRYNEENENGYLEMQEAIFKVEKINEREAKSSKAIDTKFRLEFNVKRLKSKYIYLYLDINRMVNSIVIGETKYTMRGIK